MENLNDHTTLAADLIRETINLFDNPVNVGALTAGHYVQVGMGMGFYVPEEAFQSAQSKANLTGKIQFLGVTKNGVQIHGTREEILDHPNSAGVVAWIVPA